MCETFKKSIASLTVDELRQLCLLNKITGMSAAKKADLTSALSKDYTKNCESLKKLKVDELEEMCRLKKIKGFSGYKKDDLVGLIALFDMSIKETKDDVKNTKDVKDVKDVKEVKEVKEAVAEPGETKPKKEPVAVKEASILELDEQMQELKARLELVEQIKKAKQEQERLDKERLDKERLEKERLDKERLDKERLDKERLDKERLEKERLDKERLEKERIDKERIDKERLDKERLDKEQERLERERTSEQSSVVDETTGVKKERKKKEIIPKSVRSHVWNLYIGPTINEHRCLCCKKAIIKITDFDCGHVIAESAGGTHEIGNLRPICSACNHAMGSQNMIEFVVKYGYYIG